MTRTARITIDQTGTVVAAGPDFSALLRTSDDQIGRNAIDLTAPGDRDRCILLVGRVIAEGVPLSTVKRLIRTDGTHAWIRSHLIPVDTPDERLVDVVIEESVPPPGWVEPDKLLAVARLVFESRRARAAAFGNSLFGDYAWDVLLSAYINEAEGSLITIARLHVWTSIPLATASRWIRALRGEGLLEYEDGGNTALVTTPFRLTSAAHQKFETYLSDLFGRSEGVRDIVLS